MFYIQSKVEYGLIFLVYLAQKDTAQPISLQEIVNATGMPYRYLSQIVKPLIFAKILKTKEGKNGGYVLNKKPGQIHLSQVIAVLGEPMTIARCLKSDLCSSAKGCKMKKFWQKIKDNIDQELNKLTLADLI